MHGEGGGTWAVRFDCGIEASVAVSGLRERWHVPVRVLALWGHYYPATVLEALAGLLRLDFGGGHVQWALPEQTLADTIPTAADLPEGTYVAAIPPTSTGTAIDTAVPSGAHADRFHRGLVVHSEADGALVLFEDGTQHLVEHASIRVPHDERAKAHKEGNSLLALFGDWHAGVISAETLASPNDLSGRYQCTLVQGSSCWVTQLARREMVGADGGETAPSAPLWRLRKGAALLMRGAHAGSSSSGRLWVEVLFVGKPAGVPGVVEVMLATGRKVRVPAKDVRPRDGEAHPVGCAVGEARGRVNRYNDRAALTIQRFARARKAKEDVARKKAVSGWPKSMPARTSVPSPIRQTSSESHMPAGAAAPLRSTVDCAKVQSGLLSRMLLDDVEANSESRGEAAAAAAEEVARKAAVAFAKEMSLLSEESLTLAFQLKELQKRVAHEEDKAAQVGRDVQQAEKEAAPKTAPEGQAKLRESLQKRQASLKAVVDKVGNAEGAFFAAQEEHGKALVEAAELKTSVESATADMRTLTKSLEHTRKVMEMEKAAGSAEKTEKMYEDYNARLVDSARREAEKHLKAKVQLDTNAADWVAWVTLLSSASRKLQARADAGNDAAKRLIIVGREPSSRLLAAAVAAATLGGADGSAPALPPAKAKAEGTEAKLAAGIIEKVGRNEEKLKAFRSRMQALDMQEAEANTKRSKALDKIAAHHNLTAHRTAARVDDASRSDKPKKKRLRAKQGGKAGGRLSGIVALAPCAVTSPAAEQPNSTPFSSRQEQPTESESSPCVRPSSSR